MEIDIGLPGPVRSVGKEWNTPLSEQGAEHGGVQTSSHHSWLDTQVFMNMDNCFCFISFVKINMDNVLTQSTQKSNERSCHILLGQPVLSSLLLWLQGQDATFYLWTILLTVYQLLQDQNNMDINHFHHLLLQQFLFDLISTASLHSILSSFIESIWAVLTHFTSNTPQCQHSSSLGFETLYNYQFWNSQ